MVGTKGGGPKSGVLEAIAVLAVDKERQVQVPLVGRP
jgi:hypothetical protein